MAALTTTARRMSMLPGAIARPHTAGGSGTVGNLVYIAADGDVEVTDADSAGTLNAIGIVISAGSEGATTFAAGDAVSVVVYGPVSGFSGLTPGALGYVANTAGGLDSAAGTNSRVAGFAESATVFFVDPVRA